MKLPLITLAALAAGHGSLPEHTIAAPVTCVRSCAARHTGTTVTGISVVPTSGRADVVIGIESPVEVQDFTLDSPYRVVIDLKGATLDASPAAYDRIARGGITDIRVSQFRSNVVRLVVQLDGVHPYEVKRGSNEIRLSVNGGSTSFAKWTGSDRERKRSTRRRSEPPGDRRCSAELWPDAAAIYAAANHRDVSGCGHPRRHRRIRKLLWPYDHSRPRRSGDSHSGDPQSALGRRVARDPTGPGVGGE